MDLKDSGTQRRGAHPPPWLIHVRFSAFSLTELDPATHSSLICLNLMVYAVANK